MTRQRRRVERLLWLRNLRRTQAIAALALAQRRVDDAERATERAEMRARESADALARLARAGLPAASLRSADGGVAAARQEIRVAHRRGDAARRERAERSRAAVHADRQMHAAERAQERVLCDERRSLARAEQRQVDETAARGWRTRDVLGAALLVLSLAVVAPLPASAAPGEAPVSSAAVAPSQLEMAFSGIRVRQAELDRRERELIDRERKLSALESAVDKRLRELEEISREVELRITAWAEVDEGQSLSRLSRIYASMPAQQAAPLLQRLDIELATQIVAKMKPKQSSALLALLSPDRAQEMSERIAHPLSMKPVGEETPG